MIRRADTARAPCAASGGVSLTMLIDVNTRVVKNNVAPTHIVFESLTLYSEPGPNFDTEKQKSHPGFCLRHTVRSSLARSVFEGQPV